jgi:hypothetical protein
VGQRLLRGRDGVCRFVGCTRPAAYCDLDHTVAWEDGGGTDDCNLAYLCKAHHRLKHASGWTVTQAGDGSGTLTWTTSRGKSYTTYAGTVLPPPKRKKPSGGRLQIHREWLEAASTGEAPPF